MEEINKQLEQQKNNLNNLILEMIPKKKHKIY